MLVVFTYKEWLLFLCLFSNRQKMRLLCLNLGLFFLEMYLFLFDSIPPNSFEPFNKKKGEKKKKKKLSSGEISCLFCLHAPQPAQIKPCASLISQHTINNKNKDKRENVQKPTWPKQYGTELKQLQIELEYSCQLY